ncbi:hypothetical protein EV715DRAFT_166565, partial [Schizophyllum commune]
PMRVWRDYKQTFLNELLRHEGLASDLNDTVCSSCSASFDSGEGLIKCTSCGVFVECTSCCVQRHECLPHHRIEVC